MATFKVYKDELSPAAGADSFRLGYIGSKNRKLTIASNVHLAEAYSNAKDGWVTLWGDPHETTTIEVLPTARSEAFPNSWHLMQLAVKQHDSSPAAAFESCMLRLRNKRGKDIPEFKIRVWVTEMLSEDVPPKIPVVNTGRKAGVAIAVIITSVSGKFRQDQDQPEVVRHGKKSTNPFSHYLAVERAIKSLEETGVITNEQFAQQKAKLFGELSSL